MTNIELCEQYKLKQQLLFGYQKMEFEYEDGEVKLIKFNESETDTVVNIPDFVTLVTSEIFRECKNISKVNANNIYGYISRMFAYYEGEKLDLSEFDTSKVTDMSSMFIGCSSLKELDISNFNTSKVTDMSGMFAGCSSLKELDISNFNTSKVIDMRAMFIRCSRLEELGLSKFNASKLTDMEDVFMLCKKLDKCTWFQDNQHTIKILEV